MQAIRLVSTKDLSHEDWLNWRRKGIGGSDVAPICRMSRYRSPMDVYRDKLGLLPPIEDNAKMKAGRKLEPLIADWFAEETGYKVWRQHAMFQHPEHAFMLANIDRWLPGMNAGLECKNTSEYNRDDWGVTGAPKEYVLQCTHYMAVTGAERWFIAVLLGGWDFQWRTIERNESLIQDIITVEKEFWKGNVLAKRPPELTHRDTGYIDEMYPKSKPLMRVDLPEDAYPIIQEFEQTRALKKDAEQQEETAKNQIKGMMGNAEIAYWQGEPKFSWKSNARSRPFKIIGGSE